jgi:tRNA dimethylallyltransferase
MTGRSARDAPEGLPPAVFLLGPTASGKTALALDLVDRLPLEIISVDSALVYRDMNIGTAKPDAGTLASYPHHLVDLIPPTEAYSAARFCTDARAAMRDISARGKVPLLVGGTMLYAKALTEGLSELPVADPQIRAALEARASRIGWPGMHAELARIDAVTAARLPPTDSQRIQRALEVYEITGSPISALQGRAAVPSGRTFRALKIGLIPRERATLHARIVQRLRHMLAQGFVAEVMELRHAYALTADMPSMRCVGYRQVWDYLEKASPETTEAALLEKCLVATRQLAKRQMTWLRSMTDMQMADCFDPGLAAHVAGITDAFIGRRQQ